MRSCSLMRRSGKAKEPTPHGSFSRGVGGLGMSDPGFERQKKTLLLGVTTSTRREVSSRRDWIEPPLILNGVACSRLLG